MKGRNRGIMIMPANSKELAKAQHWLMSRDKEFKEFQLPVNETETQTMLMTTFDWVDMILYKLTFSFKTEKVSVFS